MEPTSIPLIGQTFGKCILLKLIGTGGMGGVYLAEHLFLKRRVAIKILSRDLASDPEEVARFEREAIAAARLDHENIVTIYDVDEVQGRPFIVMEYVEGEDLESLIQRRAPIPVVRAARIIRGVTIALDHAHRRGTVHRDIKPGNILLGRNGKIKITDFGLAQRVGTREEPVNGTVTGTPFFASPEQIQGQVLDGRSDLYSLGVTFYQMLTAKRPFEGRSPDSVVRKHLEDPRPSLSSKRPEASRLTNAIVKKMMALKADDRYPTAKALLKDLNLLLTSQPFTRMNAGTTRRISKLEQQNPS